MPHFPEDMTTPSQHMSPSPSERESYTHHRIRIKNRRMRYLSTHPDYFTSPDLELADPLLYDRLVRRFQSAAEREQEGRRRGYTGVLEADLFRSEAKLAALQQQLRPSESSSRSSSNRNNNGNGIDSTAAGTFSSSSSSSSYYSNGRILDEEEEEEEEDEEEAAPNKESAWKRFVDVMTQRFLRGHDGDFDYAAVDDSEEYDDREEEERRRLELYIDNQTPEFLGEGLPGGETGIQDF